MRTRLCYFGKGEPGHNILLASPERNSKGLVKKYRRGWAGAERGWVMRF